MPTHHVTATQPKVDALARQIWQAVHPIHFEAFPEFSGSRLGATEDAFALALCAMACHDSETTDSAEVGEPLFLGFINLFRGDSEPMAAQVEVEGIVSDVRRLQGLAKAVSCNVVCIRY